MNNFLFLFLPNTETCGNTKVLLSFAGKYPGNIEA